MPHKGLQVGVAQYIKVINKLLLVLFLERHYKHHLDGSRARKILVIRSSFKKMVGIANMLSLFVSEWFIHLPGIVRIFT